MLRLSLRPAVKTEPPAISPPQRIVKLFGPQQAGVGLPRYKLLLRCSFTWEAISLSDPLQEHLFSIRGRDQRWHILHVLYTDKTHEDRLRLV